MSMDLIKKRFENLDVEFTQLEHAEVYDRGDAEHLLFEDSKWFMSAESLLFQVFGVDHPVVRKFSAVAERVSRAGKTVGTDFRQAKAIWKSGKEQFEGGYLFEIKDLVHQEVFEDELEQAEYFLKGKWIIPALVIAGTVLERKLRDLCNRRSIEIDKPTIEPMRVELAKADVFASSVSTEILAWGQNRNAAAHGKQEKLKLLKPTDVQRMIDGIRDFIKTH